MWFHRKSIKKYTDYMIKVINQKINRHFCLKLNFFRYLIKNLILNIFLIIILVHILLVYCIFSTFIYLYTYIHLYFYKKNNSKKLILTKDYKEMYICIVF